MSITRSRRPIAAARLVAAAYSLLDASPLCAIATVSSGGDAYVNTAYFAWSRAFAVVWMSEPQAQHSRNLRSNDSAAVAVYDSRQRRGRPDRGIQLFGAAGQAEDRDADAAEAVYAGRFPEFAHTDLGAYRFFVLQPRRIKLFDERALGTGTFVTANIDRRGRLRWERTEIYGSTK